MLLFSHRWGDEHRRECGDLGGGGFSWAVLGEEGENQRVYQEQGSLSEVRVLLFRGQGQRGGVWELEPVV